MRVRVSALVAALLAAGSGVPSARAAGPEGWGVAEEARMAAEAASWAPPDFKRQLARNSRRLMQGVADAAAGDRLEPGASANRDAAARGARALAAAIRRHDPFDSVAYQAGAILHAAAMAYAPDEPPAAPSASAFLGFPAEPFAAPEGLAAAQLPAGTAAERRSAAITLAARLFAWTWKTAGGDASIVKQYPESKGPYPP
ncbi:MAG TPA: hypothetical protein VMN04_11240 [Thermoanaerobaculia bacterium]|nr:hypothetical protein [Thermoanaerobaculia bacterium]